ncbi:FAD/NAD(P)-binding domain-containing protein [Schizopora paradoxa]|uniref:FAD/NAD(P)-binding domain-containing protein n=1 Tax=Schizopora paradoxa TaxID=27342 RepID=A0A0H2RL54_9AGAM|nr:FAD/NAD(P)-binding domain-containing protein [Schizopora paradoxa]
MNDSPLNPQQKKLRIAIIGGGVCGLVCAVTLMKVGVDVQLYEASAKFGEVGAGVGLGPNAIRVLEQLGLLDEVVAKSDQAKPETRPFHIASGYGDNELIYDYPVKPEDVGLGIHRVAFLDAISQFVDLSKTHFNKRCVSLNHSKNKSEIMIQFSDGTSATADVVLGADGVRSVVRTYVTEGAEGYTTPGRFVRTSYTNTLAYRGLVPDSKVVELGMKTVMNKTPICWVGLDKHIITFPIKGATLINVVAFVTDRSKPPSLDPLPQPWVTQHSTETLLTTFSDFGADPLTLLGCIESPSAWAIHSTHPLLDSYASGRVALMGDAAHAMLPHLGAGAGQGLEDAFVLVKLLSHSETTSANVESVLQAYSMVRRPRGNFVLEASARNGDIYEMRGQSGGTMEGMRKDLPGIWDFWYHDLEEDYNKAIQWLQEKQVFA